MRLLIIGNLDGQIGTASLIATRRGARVNQAYSIEAALNLLRSGIGADLIMIDIKENIKKLSEQLNLERIHVPIIGCGINNDKDEVINAINNGAKEYISLPPNEELIAAIFEAITNDNRSVLYQSEKMKEVIKIAEQIAKSDATVLITGKSGTGKEVISRFIHSKSKRSNLPLITVNCAAIPDNLLESELFGHEKGSFTGAITRRIGKFEESNNGTLLLDEISEIDLKLQAKLLRAIQEQEIDRIGGKSPIKLNLRIIATSNRDLKKEVNEGRFREDLYFRLNVININIPPLKERKDDILIFANHFIKKYSEANGIAIKPLSLETIKILQQYTWPGNVRELENTIYRAVLLSLGDKIEPDALKLETNINNENLLVGRSMASVEKDLILSTINHVLGDKISAANILGISLKELNEKLKVYENS